MPMFDKPSREIHTIYRNIVELREACIELEEEDEALKYINLVRTRAGMPVINESGMALERTLPQRKKG